MSPLTKLFVVLLVLVSVALSAGTITFVNRLDPLQRDLTATKAQLATAQTNLSAMKNDAAASDNTRNASVTAANTERDAAKADALKARTENEGLQAQVAKLNNNLAVLASSNSSASTALAASEDAKSKLQEQVTGLRKDADDRLRQVADLGQRVNKLNADLDQTEKARRNLAEQVVDSNAKVSQLTKTLGDNGISLAQVDKAGTGQGAPALNGIIRRRQNIAGKEYATISLGSQDYVTKGMQFNIIDGAGNFLGKLSVEVVDNNEAIGQISAEPANLAQIKAGNVVKTQI